MSETEVKNNSTQNSISFKKQLITNNASKFESLVKDTSPFIKETFPPVKEVFPPIIEAFP